jgi:hypothetical protein
MSDERDGEDLDILDELLEPELDDEAVEAEEGEPSGEEQEEEQPQEQRRPSSRQRAILRMRERLKQESEENRRLRDQLLTQTRQPAAPPPDPYRRVEEERQEAERVAQMMPHEQAAYYARKTEQQFSQQLMRQNLETRDLFDRQIYQSLCAQEPMAQRLANEVENTLAQARNQGMNPTREAIYNLLVGQEVRNRAKKQTDRQRKNGQARIAAQTTQPGGSRSTAAGGRRAAADPDAGLEDRLRKVTVGDAW